MVVVPLSGKIPAAKGKRCNSGCGVILLRKKECIRTIFVATVMHCRAKIPRARKQGHMMAARLLVLLLVSYAVVLREKVVFMPVVVVETEEEEEEEGKSVEV